ncbi:hypothetical protein BC835DRAFT_1311185 [Cytidiella melzeri]|nr:hypothetical protein BC835DRAFT_1311185 [Cytidiella melzeri]
MDPFPETQGIEEEVKHNKVVGDGEEGNKESEEVEETVERKLDDIYIYIKPIARHSSGNARKSFSKLSSSILPHKRLADDGHVESAHSVVDLIANRHQLLSNRGWRNRPMAEKIAANLSFERLRGNVSGEAFVAQFICVELHTEERVRQKRMNTVHYTRGYTTLSCNINRGEVEERERESKTKTENAGAGESELVLLASSAKKITRDKTHPPSPPLSPYLNDGVVYPVVGNIV